MLSVGVGSNWTPNRDREHVTWHRKRDGSRHEKLRKGDLWINVMFMPRRIYETDRWLF